MGSLSNLYISQSYQSLIHLGTDTGASGEPTQLQDGLGTNIGVYVNTNGEVSASSFSGSISGIGNVSAFSSSVNSRILAITGSTTNTGSLVTTSSFNAYTASQDFKNTTFATTSSLTNLSASLYFTDTTQSVNIASISTSVGLLQTFSGSQYKTDSASFDSRILAITASGGGVSVGTFNSYTASQDFKNTTFATTSSLNSLSASIFSTDATQSSLINGKLDTSSFTTFSTSVDSRLDLLELSGSGFATTASVNALSASIFQTDATQSSLINGKLDTSSFNTYTSSQDFKNTTFATTGSNVFIGNQTVTGSLFISGNINMVNGADIVTHHVKAPGVNGVEIQTNTGGVVALFGAGGSLGTTFYGQINATSISASTINGLGDPLAFSTSVDSRLDNLELGSASVSTSVGLLQTFSSSQYKTDSASFDSRIIAATINTSSFATTGSNNFIGNQRITGSLILSSSAAVELQVIGAVEITGSVAGNITALSVASSTASIDFNLGTFFTLTIPSSSITYITGSNLKSGMTANIVLTQQSTTGSVRFESSLFKFPSGSINTGSAVASAVDIVSVMSVGTTTLYSVGANQLL
jgi:hypothetical protein